MNIGILADRIGTQAGGLETYEWGVLKGIANIDRSNNYKVYCSNPEEVSQGISRYSNMKVVPVNPGTRKFRRYFLGLPFELIKRPVDLLHCCVAPPPFCPGKYILTIHDISPMLAPELYPPIVLLQTRMLLGHGIKYSDHIISVSEATKKDIIKHFKIPPEKIEVIHSGVEKSYKLINDKKCIEKSLKKYGISPPYILYVGKIQKRKNVSRLIDAFARIKKNNNIPHTLVLIGKKTWMSKEISATIEEVNMGHNILQLGHIDDEDIPLIYNGASLFVYPSLFEGFGFPPLEAMACGVPVLTSNVSSLPEVVGDAALTVDPYDIGAIEDGMWKLIKDKNLREEYREKGIARAKLFTWETTAKKNIKLYKKVLGIVQ